MLHIVVLLFLQCNAYRRRSDDEVAYYTNLVTDGINDALNYELPKDAEEYKPKDLTLKVYGTFDFIIIGAGASGSILAGRLAERTNFRTLVLEAGTFPNNFTNIPGMYFYDRGTEYNWGFTSVPQTTCCLGMVDHKCPFPRGRGFGGTTILNGLIYSRGNRRDFNKWASDGNSGWDYKTVLRHFIRFENCTVPDRDESYHGTRGPLNVQRAPIESPQVRAWINANEELGIPELDYNGRNQMGCSRIQSNIRNGQRLTTFKAYLQPIMGSKQLRLLPRSYVVKIVVNERTDEREVHFAHKGRMFVAKARKEIILSAGAISSPQILMLSGIGPRDHLQKLGIPVVKNLAVGDNLQDHATYYGVHFVTNFSDPAKSVKEYVKDYLAEKGFYTAAANLQGIGYYETEDNPEKGYPNMELVFVPSPVLNNYTQRAFSFTDETYRGLWGRVDGSRTFIMYVVLLRPASKGTIRLASSNPYAYPLIDPNFLSDIEGRDIRNIYETIKFVKRFEKTRAFRKINARMGEIDLPACRRFKRDGGRGINSKAYMYCNIRHLTFNLYHPVGTNKMGPNPEDGAVVDRQFRVHGFKSLRVVDASILPFSFSGHPAAPTMMIAERAIDFIVREHS